MGFFEDAVSSISTAVTQPADLIKNIGNTNRRLFGSAGYLVPFTGQAQLAADFNNQQDNIASAQAEADAAKERLDRSTQATDRLRAQQGVYAAGLKQNALRDYGLLSNQAASNERRAMAEKLREIKQNAGSRGLVGSGFQKSGEAGAKATAAANTAGKQKQIKDLLDQQILDAENLQAQIGLEMGGVQQSQADQYYQMALNNMQNRNQSLGEILGASGRLAGTYAGSQRSAS